MPQADSFGQAAAGPGQAPELTSAERAACEAMLDALIDEGRGRGFEITGLDHPIEPVRAAIGAWLVAARGFKPIVSASTPLAL